MQFEAGRTTLDEDLGGEVVNVAEGFAIVAQIVDEASERKRCGSFGCSRYF